MTTVNYVSFLNIIIHGMAPFYFYNKNINNYHFIGPQKASQEASPQKAPQTREETSPTRERRRQDR